MWKTMYEVCHWTSENERETYDVVDAETGEILFTASAEEGLARFFIKARRMERFARVYTFLEVGDARRPSAIDEVENLVAHFAWTAFCHLCEIDEAYGIEFYQKLPQKVWEYLNGEGEYSVTHFIDRIAEEIPDEAVCKDEYQNTLEVVRKRM